MEGRSIATYRAGRKLDCFLETYVGYRTTWDVINREETALTRPRVKVISSTKCEVKMTRKYSVASSMMVFKMPVTSNPVFDLLARKMINKNVRESDARTGDSQTYPA